MAVPEVACKYLKVASGTTYFLCITHSPAQGGAEGQEGSADLTVTDGIASAWEAHGLTSAELAGGGGHGGKLGHLLAAVGELENTQLQYTLDVIKQADGGLEVKAAWHPTPTAAFKVSVTASLQPTALSAVLPPLLQLLMDNVATATATAAEALQQCEEFGRQAALNQDLVQRYVSNKAAQERETNAKVAALLNSKKAKLREMREELRKTQEELEQLRQQGEGAGGGADGGGDASMEEEEEGGDLDGGSGGHSGQHPSGSQHQQAGRGQQHRRQQQQKKGYVVDDEESSEDEGEDSGGGRYMTDDER